MATRQKKTLIQGISQEQANEAFATYAKADAQIAKINADIELQCAKIREKRADELTPLSDEEKMNKKDELLANYSVKAERVHTVTQLLKAYTLFNRDDEYVVTEDGKVKIVDEQTGRIMEGRRYSDGLHQAIEAKEGVTVESATQTFATLTSRL